MDFRVEHPRFVSGHGYDRRLPIKDLRALTAAITLETGFTVRGSVSDQNARPIEGATVILSNFNAKYGPIRTKTGANGQFQFENCPPDCC